MAVVYLALDPSAHPTMPDREFSRIAYERANGNPIEVHIFSTGQQAVAYCEQYERIERLVILAHGAPEGIGWFMRNSGGGIHQTRRTGGWINIQQFARVVGPRLVQNCVVGLAACSCGISPEDWRRAKEIERTSAGSQDNEISREFKIAAYYSSSGQRSFGGKLRDGLLAAGASGVEVRAHLWRGHAVWNPHIITFRPPSGSAGFIMAHNDIGESGPMPETTSGWNRWASSFSSRWQGARATEYILGGALPDNISMSRHPVVIPGAAPSAGGSVFPDGTRTPAATERTSSGSSPESGLPPGQRWDGELPPESVLRRQTEEWASAQEGNLSSL